MLMYLLKSSWDLKTRKCNVCIINNTYNVSHMHSYIFIQEQGCIQVGVGGGGEGMTSEKLGVRGLPL